MEVELAQIIELNQKNASLKSVAMLETGNLGVDIIVDQGIALYPQVGGLTWDKVGDVCVCLSPPPVDWKEL